MSYKKNRLRIKKERISKKRSELGKLGNEVKRQRMQEQGKDLVCVGGYVSFGRIGNHCIKLYADPNDCTHYWIKSDGEWRKPRTVEGVRSVASRWFGRFALSEVNNETKESGNLVIDYQI